MLYWIVGYLILSLLAGVLAGRFMAVGMGTTEE